MTQNTRTTRTGPAPDGHTLTRATAIAPIVAVFLLAVAGLDPLGLEVAGLARGQQTSLPIAGQPLGPPITPKPGGPLAPTDTTYKVDAIEFQLMPGEFVEYKFRLKTGAMMMFNWKSTGPVEVDFHTVPDGKPLSASETFFRGTVSGGQGTYRAPYPGLHGWYWNNAGKETIKLVINASGFFTEARMYSGDPNGEPMEVKDPPPPEY